MNEIYQIESNLFYGTIIKVSSSYITRLTSFNRCSSFVIVCYNISKVSESLHDECVCESIIFKCECFMYDSVSEDFEGSSRNELYLHSNLRHHLIFLAIT